MHRNLVRAAAVVAACTTYTRAVFSQVNKPEGAHGPSLSGFLSDMAAWGASHPGAAIALIGVGVIAIGMVVYNRIRPQS